MPATANENNKGTVQQNAEDVGAKETTDPTKPEVSEYAKWALDEKDKKEKDSVQADNDGDDDPGPTKKISKADNDWQKIGKVSKSELEQELDNATEALKAAEKAVRDLNTKRKEHEDKLKHIEHGYRWFSMI